jgi:hypothetical protein
MPTKTDRILGYLPATFDTSLTPPRTVLYSVANVFGNELLLGENSLAAIMLAHWVDFADKNATEIDDLEKMAALYGLVPWRDESGQSLETVEEFREHLKRYVRTFVEGTVTVQGILRVTAESLALRIADAPEDLDRWWTRGRDAVVTIDALGNDASAQLNFDRPSARGSAALPAHIDGTVDLSEGINLTGANILRLKVDGSFEEIDLTEGIAPTDPLALQQVVDIINKPPRPTIASHDGRYLKLTSLTSGPTSRLEVINGLHDASLPLLGLAPRTYHGVEATAADVKGTADLSSPIDLSDDRYLRLEIDGQQEEIDCAGDNPPQTTLANVRDKINNAFPGLNVASDDGNHLILTSPKKGIGSTISVQPPAAQNAAPKILGVPSIFAAGVDALPARADGTRDLRAKVDLSERANIRLRIDSGPAKTINCAGVEPEKTERVEIVAAINAAFSAPLANVTERGVSVSSPTGGSTSQIVFEKPNAGDATFDIFGIGPLSFQGRAATKAHLTATPKFTESIGLDVRASNFLSLSVDGGTPVEIDLQEAAEDLQESQSLPLEKVAEHIDNSVGEQIASTDGEHLFLASPRIGSISQLEILPRETANERRFVTRATIVDEAAAQVFGFFAKEARGQSAVAARLTGGPDLSQSVDLRDTRFLRLQVDTLAPIEIDCAGARPRATTLPEIIEKINTALKSKGVTKDVASDDGKHLVLISPVAGATSRLAIEPPRVALDRLMDVEPETFRGADATTVKFTSTIDLTAGIDLPPNAKIKLAVDGAAPVEIVLGDQATVHRSPSEIVNTINTALLAPVAKTDGRRVQLISAKKGIDSRIDFQTPSADDVTKEIFGITPPRAYHGANATPAKVVGRRDLSGATDLTVFRFLRVSLDGGPGKTFDCAAKAAKPEAATLAEIVNSIGPEVASASANGKYLILTSASTGQTAQITLESFADGDAAKALFGSEPLAASGSSALPAVVTGTTSLRLPVDLSRRGVLRIAVDGGPTAHIDVAGAVPAKTALDEIVARINAVFQNVAAGNVDDQLQLTSPNTGPESTISVQPLRYLEVIEYPPRAAAPLSFSTRHNDSWSITNEGVTDTFAEVNITAPQGTVGPGLVNLEVGWTIRLFIVLEKGETARLFRDTRLGLRAEVIRAGGQAYPVPGSKILVGPIGAQAWVPFDKPWVLTGDGFLQLNNPQARGVVRLTNLHPKTQITVDTLEHDISSPTNQTIEANGELARLVGRVKTYKDKYQLVDGSDNPIVDLLPGPDVKLRAYLNKAVKVEGPIHGGTPPVMLVQFITRLFDVTLSAGKNGAPVDENYLGVSIGVGTIDPDSLVTHINAGIAQNGISKLVRAEDLHKDLVLSLPPGKSEFRYLDCLGSRFDRARFDRSRFPDGVCGERGIFDVSRFSNAPPEKVGAVFASSHPFSEPPVHIEFRSRKFAAGSFVVNLPADLSPRFGGRFDDARFGQDKNSPELYAGAVIEPEDDPKFLVKLMDPQSGHESDFVKATLAGNVELGWTAARIPFRKPQFLTLGGPGRAARLYLSGEGLNGFIKLDAKQEGAWGNEIAVSAREVGPAIYDVSVFYRGACFEQARAIALGIVNQKVNNVEQPGPTGVLQAKAAGVRADATRDRADNGQLTII